MAIDRTSLLRLTVAVRDVLRTGLNTEIARHQSDLAAASITVAGFQALADTSEQVTLGDLLDYEALIYPAVRVTFPRIDFRGHGSQRQSKAQAEYAITVYVSDVANEDRCFEEVISDLHQSGICYIESVRAVLERDLALSGSARPCIARIIERIDAPQDPENPCVLRDAYRLIATVNTRLIQSAGPDTT